MFTHASAVAAEPGDEVKLAVLDCGGGVFFSSAFSFNSLHYSLINSVKTFVYLWSFYSCCETEYLLRRYAKMIYLI